MQYSNQEPQNKQPNNQPLQRPNLAKLPEAVFRYRTFQVTNLYHLKNLIYLSGYEREIRFACKYYWNKTLKLQSQYSYILYGEKHPLTLPEPSYNNFTLNKYYDSIYTPVSYVSACIKANAPYKDCVIINSFATHPAYRNSGLCKKILKILIAKTKRPIITIVPYSYVDVCCLLTRLKFTSVSNVDFNDTESYLKSAYLFLYNR